MSDKSSPTSRFGPLKPCPFCGCDVRFIEQSSYIPGAWHRIICDVCKFNLDTHDPARWNNRPSFHERMRALPPEDAPASEKQASNPDTARLDHLAEITNLAALQEHGAMLRGEQVRKIEETAKALSVGYERHRRTHDTPEAFRLSVDDAIKECK